MVGAGPLKPIGHTVIENICKKNKKNKPQQQKQQQQKQRERE